MTGVRHAEAPDRWLVPLSEGTERALPLICFPYAGAAPAMFRPLAQHLSHAVRIHAVQLPGHAVRIREKPLTRMAQVVEALDAALAPFISRPFALFGHSLGALAAFEVARRLQSRYRLSPTHLIVSGCRAPQLPRTGPMRHLMSDEALVAAMVALGASPEPFEIDELRHAILPVLRADIELVERWQFSSEPPLTCPITAMAGAFDPEAPPSDMARWSEETASRFDMHVFEGNHFFFDACLPRIANVLSAVLPLPEMSR